MQLLKFLPVLLLYYVVGNVWERFTKSTSQALSATAYVRKKALNPGRKIECTHARMVGKPPDAQFWKLVCKMEFRICVEKGGEISKTLKKCVDNCCLQEMRWKGQK